MTNRTRFLLSISFLTLFCVASSGALNPVRLTNFKIGFSKVSPKLFPSSQSPEVGWTPIFDLGIVALRGDISIFSAKRSTSSKFMITNYELLGMLSVLPLITLEAGGGMQNWHGQGGISPVATAGIMFRIGEFIDRLYFDFSRVFAKNNETNEIHIGIGLNL
ncbi:MAG: hypothetical protein EBR01_04350 [Proteobacteria bacterium]|nr:hypothetical protein [Pseudomonadota bacterium]